MQLNFKKITIVGVGLIGGSIGLALKKRNFKGTIMGVGRRTSSLKQAEKKKAVDETTLNLERGVKDADFIIVATPTDKTVSISKKILKYTPANSVMIDVASVKKDIVREIQKNIPKNKYFVGTHPIAGLQKSGVEYSEVDLFKDAVCILTPTNVTDKKALNKVKKFWEFLGSYIYQMTPQHHDKVLALTSHMPHLLAYILTKQAKSFIKITGGSFKDATRVAESSPEMWADIFIKNKINMIRSIKDLTLELQKIASLIKEDKRDNLIKILNSSRQIRKKIN